LNQRPFGPPSRTGGWRGSLSREHRPLAASAKSGAPRPGTGSGARAAGTGRRLQLGVTGTFPGVRARVAAGSRRCGGAPAYLRTDSVAVDDPQIRPPLLCLQDRRLPLPGQILEGVRVKQRLLEVSTLAFADLAQRRICDDHPNAAAQLRARHSRRLGDARRVRQHDPPSGVRTRGYTFGPQTPAISR
jgi:hypothetical protein